MQMTLSMHYAHQATIAHHTAHFLVIHITEFIVFTQSSEATAEGQGSPHRKFLPAWLIVAN